ncbi:MAG: alpha-1,4-glucan--maltose-1-phosphate maltosyltransferase [Actinomycetota bacterium]
MEGNDGRRRVVIEGVQPEIDCGRFPIKRVAGDTVTVVADVFADGHDQLAAVLAWRPEDSPASPGGDGAWTEVPMEPLGNDRWQASFPVADMGRYRYTVRGWVDRIGTWHRGLLKKVDAGQDVALDLLIGAGILKAAAGRAAGADAAQLNSLAKRLEAAGAPARSGGDSPAAPTPVRPAPAPAQPAPAQPLGPLLDAILLDAINEQAGLAAAYPDRSLAGQYDRELAVVVDRPRAAFSAWYELFPRSCAAEAGEHGTLADVERRLPYVAGMGFDVVYLPPVHPIGTSHRKGKNNTTQAAPGDPGSPWAIGSALGGHSAIHPDLGTIEDFDHLILTAQRLGLEIALDFAIQCSPDHPWVAEHPEWFRRRPDGTLQYAENPPKRYQDIYNVNWDSPDWRGLWEALLDVVLHWVDCGITVFRVDNPHTKPFAFWAWLIEEVHDRNRDVIFLAEAFTRPRVMYRLAKLGFTQSYTYFTWRSAKEELTDYVTELTTTELAEYFRPNFWPNTPDILATQLRDGGRPAFIARLVLAATLSRCYGIYGPVFELGEHQPVTPLSEEYLNSEKYEIRTWDLTQGDSLSELIAVVNRARRTHAALQGRRSVSFHAVDNDALIAYSLATPDRSSVILVVVNLDPHAAQLGWVDLPLDELGLPSWTPYPVDDLLTESRYLWSGARNYVRLDPALPAHIFVLRQPPPPGAGA